MFFLLEWDVLFVETFLQELWRHIGLCIHRNHHIEPRHWVSSVIIVNITNNIIISITIYHSFPRQNFTNSAHDFGKFNGNTDEIPWLTEATKVKFGSFIKSWIDKSNTCYKLQYSLINNQSTITIKPKINVNKLISFVLWRRVL